jgi:hypothetical protein
VPPPDAAAVLPPDPLVPDGEELLQASNPRLRTPMDTPTKTRDRRDHPGDTPLQVPEQGQG